MTLLEVILAIAVTGFLLAAAATFVVSISSIWMNREDRNFFEDHVDGVAEFLQGCFSQAGVSVTLEKSTGSDDSQSPQEESGDTGTPPEVEGSITGPDGDGSKPKETDSSRVSAGLVRSDPAPIAFKSPPGFADYKDPLLHFRLSKKPPLLIGQDRMPAQFIDAYIYFDPSEGLSLIWYSNLQEEVKDTRDLRRTLVSPWVTAIHYIYWDEQFERWEEEDEPMKGDDDGFLLPRFLKIVFTYEDESKERLLTIPVPSISLPLF